jgi:uncharacterized protein (TIGR02996 family)
MRFHPDRCANVTERDTLLAAVLADPADDTARLVLADMLRESDDPETQAYGRFLWAGVTVSRFNAGDVIDVTLYSEAQSEIASVVSAGFPAQWLSSLGLGPRPLAASDWTWSSELNWVTIQIGGTFGVFERGMLSELYITLGQWYEVAQKALSWPLKRVIVQDVPGLAFWIDPPTEERTEWLLSLSLTRQPQRPSSAPRGFFRRLAAAVFGTPDSEIRPLAPMRWSSERLFHEREELVASIVSASASLVDKVRTDATGYWPSPSF